MPPERSGFGRAMIENVVGKALEGDVMLVLPAQGRALRDRHPLGAGHLARLGGLDSRHSVVIGRARKLNCGARLNAYISLKLGAPIGGRISRVPGKARQDQGEIMVTRRDMTVGGVALAALAVAGAGALRWRGGGADAATETFEVTRTPEEWRKLLTPEQYAVLREEDTERPFTSPLNDEKRKGVFACAGCDLPLFSSETKFDSGTGWPSFYAPIEGAVRTGHRLHLRHGPRGGALPPLRRPSRSCVRRRPEADGPALLHQRRGAEIRPGLAAKLGLACQTADSQPFPGVPQLS